MNLLCCNTFHHGWHFSSKGPETDMTVLLFWPPISILRFLAQNTLLYLSDAPNTGEKGSPKHKRLEAGAPPCFPGPEKAITRTNPARPFSLTFKETPTTFSGRQEKMRCLQQVTSLPKVLTACRIVCVCVQVEIVPNCFLLNRYSSLMELFSHQEDSQPAE